MRTSSFLPNLLQRVAEVAIGLVLLTFLLTVVYTAFLAGMAYAGLFFH